jgi:hypothetical protein
MFEIDDGQLDGEDLDGDDDDVVRPDLGTCCACGKTGPDVRNIIMLDKKAPVPGRGWGCLQCGLPPDGASVVVCDGCLDAKAPYKFACSGWLNSRARVPFDSLAGTHEHDMSRHPEARPRIRLVQLLCPHRHCIVGAAYDPADGADAVSLMAAIRDSMKREGIEWRCWACGSEDLRFEDAPTRYTSMAEAKPHLDELQVANVATRAAIELERQTRAN